MVKKSKNQQTDEVSQEHLMGLGFWGHSYPNPGPDGKPCWFYSESVIKELHRMGFSRLRPIGRPAKLYGQPGSIYLSITNTATNSSAKPNYVVSIHEASSNKNVATAHSMEEFKTIIELDLLTTADMVAKIRELNDKVAQLTEANKKRR